MKLSLAGVGRIFLTMLALGGGAVATWYLWDYYMEQPWTRDGRVRAEVVQVSADVSGLVATVMVRDNQPVSRGDVLFILDRKRFELALELANAAVAGQQAQLAEAQREERRNRSLGDLVSAEISEKSAARVLELKATLAQASATRRHGASESGARSGHGVGRWLGQQPRIATGRLLDRRACGACAARR